MTEEQTFVRCLREQWIRGISLDVHYAYPLPPEHPLWSMPNLIMTPHISGSAASPYFLERIYDIFSQNLDRFMSSRPLLNELSKAQVRGNDEWRSRTITSGEVVCPALRTTWNPRPRQAC